MHSLLLFFLEQGIIGSHCFYAHTLFTIATALGQQPVLFD